MKLTALLFTRNNLVTLTLLLAVVIALATGLNADASGVKKLDADNLGGRMIMLVSTSAQAGSQTAVSVVIDSQGDEVASSFTLNFDPAVLSNPVVALGF